MTDDLEETLFHAVRTAGGGRPLSEARSRAIVAAVLEAVGEHERTVRSARVRAGQAAKGPGGRPPFGWRYEGKELVPDRREQKVITLARQLRDYGLSTRQIAVRLEQAGHRPKVGAKWSSAQVGRLLVERPEPGPHRRG